MGVEFFPCHYCDESICDCGDYVRCECGRKWCTVECAAEEGFEFDDDDMESCSFCRKEDVEDSVLVEFFLNKYNVSRDTVIEEYYKSNPEEEEDE